MMQGDSYGLMTEITTPEGVTVTAEDVSDVEITVGFFNKTFSNGEIIFDDEEGVWVVPLTQEETFQLPVGKVKAQVRVVWEDGTVEGSPLGEIRVHESVSKEVLSQ